MAPDVDDPVPAALAELPPLRPVVRWGPVTRLAEALAGGVAARPSSWVPLARLVAGMTDPLRRLDALAAELDLAAHGDADAAGRVRTTVEDLAALGSTAVDRAEEGCGRGGCGGCQRRAGCGGCGQVVTDLPGPTGRRDAGRETGERREGGRAEPGEVGHEVLDQGALVDVLLAAVAVAGPSRHDVAVRAVTALVVGAGLAGSLARTLADGGEPGLVSRLESLAGAGQLRWVSVPAAPGGAQLLMSGGPGGLGMPGGGIPGAGIPGTGHGVPGVGSGLEDWRPGRPAAPDDIEELVGDRFRESIKDMLGLDRPPRWDAEIADHGYRFWDPPRPIIDPSWWDDVRCFLEARQLLARVQEPPPTRPPRAVWADGITEVVLSGPCAGATLTIRGTGFGATQPGGVVLLVPRLHGCRPTQPRSWSDTEVVVELPADVVSGAVGFADAAYVAAYDAWADRRNAASTRLGQLDCITHVTTLVARFAECPPASPVNRIRAGAPVITSFTANGRALLPLEPNTVLRLAWSVRNAESVVVQRTSGVGPTFAGGVTTLSDPPFSSTNLGTAAYSRRQVWRWLITATGPCGAVTRDVTVVAGRRPRLRVESLEVTQSIQRLDGRVPMVERKPTVVRATVRHGIGSWHDGEVPAVRGRLRARGPDVGTSPWFDAANGGGAPMAASATAAITVPLLPARDDPDDTLNFLVPPRWARGSGTRFDVEVRVTGFGAEAGFAGYSEEVTGRTGPVAFHPRRALQLRYVRIAWNGLPAPTHQECIDTLRAAVPLLPTPVAGIGAVPGVGVVTVLVGSGDGTVERDALLQDWHERHTCDAFEALLDAFGWECPDDDGAIWVLIYEPPPGGAPLPIRGRAYGIPSTVCFTPTDGPYAAHEIAHCLGQQHVRTNCGGAGLVPQGGDAASAWANNGVLVDTPFDVVRNSTLAVQGGQVGDLMSYCPGYWPMPERWDRLWTAIGA